MSQGALESRTPVKLAVDTLDRSPRCQRVDDEHEDVVKRVVGDVHFWSADFLAEKTSQQQQSEEKNIKLTERTCAQNADQIFSNVWNVEETQ
jgi:hypothetical protein